MVDPSFDSLTQAATDSAIARIGRERFDRLWSEGYAAVLGVMLATVLAWLLVDSTYGPELDIGT